MNTQWVQLYEAFMHSQGRVAALKEQLALKELEAKELRDGLTAIHAQVANLLALRSPKLAQPESPSRSGSDLRSIANDHSPVSELFTGESANDTDVPPSPSTIKYLRRHRTKHPFGRACEAVFKKYKLSHRLYEDLAEYDIDTHHTVWYWKLLHDLFLGPVVAHELAVAMHMDMGHVFDEPIHYLGFYLERPGLISSAEV
ncbi:hypothetical protein BDY19DRAFT_906494 [Irpex rosettiformis]|uniref:Uncharacterized protein n=1 Tax=Irpex rosettiformis TaxID=378272 RepID=A0ACB8U2B9_9APHY|nr:hypothetical protein BDY19DRAFT_906494 [Irpex rosettiformis]